MRGITGWGYRPYRPAYSQDEARAPFVVRIAPHEDWFEAEWLDQGCPDEAHTVSWRVMGSEAAFAVRPLPDRVFRIEGLSENTDYEFCVARADGSARSALRYVRTGPVPGAKNGCPGSIVNYLHPADPIYAFSGRALCSPSFTMLESGAILASMDVFASNEPQNLTLIFRSDDGGASWRYVTDLFPCYWATLFTHRGRLYIQGCSTEYGDILIGESKDEGLTWSKPVRLFVGSSSARAAGWQRTPMPILRHHGRLWVSVDYGAWAEGGHRVGALSIGEDDDLLVSENWTCTGLAAYDPAWPGAPKGKSSGVLEGSMVVDREGNLLDITRVGLVGCEPSHGVAVAFKADAEDPEKALAFHAFVDLPSGSNAKTHILYDGVSDRYVAIGDVCVDPETPGQRNVLALEYSEDLRHWHIAKLLLDYRDESPKDVGFQYIYFMFDGDDILYLSRTSLNGARNFHDANYSVMHRVKDFRSLLK